jgi:hypothetical protein
MSYVLSGFILPLIALMTKIIYKNYCSKKFKLNNEEIRKFNLLPNKTTDAEEAKNLGLTLEEYEASKAFEQKIENQKIQEEKDRLFAINISDKEYIATNVYEPKIENQRIQKEQDQLLVNIQEQKIIPVNDRAFKKPPKNKDYKFYTVQELEQAAEYYIQQSKVQDKIRPQIRLPDLTNKNSLTDKEIIDHWLDHYQGFCIGEFHTESIPKEFLVDNMAYLKQKGVKVLFMEQLYDDCQEELDAFLNGKPLSTEIITNLDVADTKDNFQPPYGYKGVIEAAAREGIRIVAIDTKGANVPERENRWKWMNYFAYKTMKKTIKTIGDGKYVALMGAGHLSKRKNYIPGVTDLLSYPNIIISNHENALGPSIQMDCVNVFDDVITDLLYVRSASKPLIQPV